MKALPIQKNKTYTFNPSYVNGEKQTQSQIRQNLHLIINKASYLALRKQVKTATFNSTQFSQKQNTHSKSLNPKDMLTNVVGGKPIEQKTYSKIMGCLPNKNSLSQLWFLLPDEFNDNCFYIHNIQTNLYLKTQFDKLYLAPKQKTKQFQFQIIKQAQNQQKPDLIYKTHVLIKSLSNGKCLNLRGALGLVEMNSKSQFQQFYFQKVNLYEPIILKDTFILMNPQDKDKGKAFLSVNKQKEEINYAKLDHSLYQRWTFYPSLDFLNKGLSKQQNRVNKKDQNKLQQQNQNISKLNQLPRNQFDILAKFTNKVLQNQDKDCYQIINFKLQKSLTLIQQRGSSRLSFRQKGEKRQWKIQSDGFSLKIKHAINGEYLGVKQDEIVFSKFPQHWQIYNSFPQQPQINTKMKMKNWDLDDLCVIMNKDLYHQRMMKQKQTCDQ